MCITLSLEVGNWADSKQILWILSLIGVSGNNKTSKLLFSLFGCTPLWPFMYPHKNDITFNPKWHCCYNDYTTPSRESTLPVTSVRIA